MAHILFRSRVRSRSSKTRFQRLGPRMEPCGHSLVVCFEIFPCFPRYTDRSLRKSATRAYRFLGQSLSCRRWSMIGHHTWSNTPLISNKRTYLSAVSFIISLIFRITSVVDFPLRKPNWFAAAYRRSRNSSRSLSARYFIINFIINLILLISIIINFSRYFLITRRRQIGQYDAGSDVSLSGLFKRARIESLFHLWEESHNVGTHWKDPWTPFGLPDRWP